MQDNIEVGTNQVMSRLTSVSNGIINLNSLDLDSPGMLNFRFQGGFIFGRASKVQGCFEVPPPPQKKKRVNGWKMKWFLFGRDMSKISGGVNALSRKKKNTHTCQTAGENLRDFDR